jgi:hypothetical protein
MEQLLSWKANSRSAGQGTSRPLRNPKVNFSVHKNQPLVHILTQINPVQNLIYVLQFL